MAGRYVRLAGGLMRSPVATGHLAAGCDSRGMPSQSVPADGQLPAIERILIFSKDVLPGEDEVERLLRERLPGPLPAGLVSTVRATSLRSATAEWVVRHLESQGELSSGAATRMRTALTGRYLVAVIPAAESPVTAGIVRKLRTSGGPLPGDQEQVATRLAELVDTNHRRFSSLTTEQQDLVLNRVRLDKLARWRRRGSTLDDWLRGPVEVRSIGRQLHREGGTQLMVAVAERASVLSETRVALRVIEFAWDGIGGWRG